MHMEESGVECNEETTFKKQRNQANCSQHYCFGDLKHYQNWFIISYVFHFELPKDLFESHDMYKNKFFLTDHL